MTLKRVLAVSLALVACGDDDSAGGRGDGAIEKAPYALCDGSDDIRLALTTAGGGPLPDDYAFSNPYGGRFLYVDGKCNFIANAEASGRLLRGTLSAQQGKTLSDSLDLEGTSGLLYRFDGGCPDAPQSTVITPAAFLQSGCGDDPPANVAAAFKWESAFALAKSNGRLSDGLVSIVAVPDGTILNSATLWPFSIPVEQATYTRRSGSSNQDVPQFAQTVSGADLTVARELWSHVDPTQPAKNYVPVVAAGKTYQLYFRDELEQTTADKLTTFFSRYNLTSPRPVARCDGARSLTTKLSGASVSDRVFQAMTGDDAPCGVELCWDGSFDESHPVQAHLALQEPVNSRTCLGSKASYIIANLQPLIEAYRASYPGSPVEINLGFGTLFDAEGDDAICRALSVESCTSDARCAPIDGSLNDATRACTVPSVALGCKAKTKGCDAALTGGEAPDGRRAVFTSGCIPEGWTRFYGEALDYSLPLCAP